MAKIKDVKYDANGNMQEDSNKKIAKIQYNFLNLPVALQFTNGNRTDYEYGSDGIKHRVTYSTAVANVSVPMGEMRALPGNQVSATHTVDYCGNVIYEGGNLNRILTEEGYITLSGGTPTYHYYLKDHQGNNRVVTYWNGSKWVVEQVNHYYPFGGLFAEGTAVSNQAYKYNGKELDRMHGLDWYDYGARHYDAALGRFTTVDPLAEKYYSTSPYGYCMGNPIKLIDPNGMDIYRYDSKSGKFTLEVSNNDDFDQVGRFKLNKETGEYTLMTNKKGAPKTIIDKIEKHILSDGINFKENNNVIAVGGEGQASIEGVEDFMLKLSNMIDKEIGGYYLSNKNHDNIDNVYVSRYKKNTSQQAFKNFDLYRTKPNLLNKVDIKVDFHTHLSRFGDNDRLRPSTIGGDGGDIGYKERLLKNNPMVKFIIVTNPKTFEY